MKTELRQRYARICNGFSIRAASPVTGHRGLVGDAGAGGSEMHRNTTPLTRIASPAYIGSGMRIDA